MEALQCVLKLFLPTEYLDSVGVIKFILIISAFKLLL